MIILKENTNLTEVDNHYDSTIFFESVLEFETSWNELEKECIIAEHTLLVNESSAKIINEGLGETLKKWFQAVMNFFKKIFAAIKNGIAKFWNWITGNSKKIKEEIKEAKKANPEAANKERVTELGKDEAAADEEAKKTAEALVAFINAIKSTIGKKGIKKKDADNLVEMAEAAFAKDIASVKKGGKEKESLDSAEKKVDAVVNHSAKTQKLLNDTAKQIEASIKSKEAEMSRLSEEEQKGEKGAELKAEVENLKGCLSAVSKAGGKTTSTLGKCMNKVKSSTKSLISWIKGGSSDKEEEKQAPPQAAAATA